MIQVVTTNKASLLMGASHQEKSTRTEKPVGDPRFLMGIQWCINKRCELMGLDAPKSSKQTNYEVNASTPKPVLRRIAAGMSADVAYAEFVSGINTDKWGA